MKRVYSGPMTDAGVKSVFKDAADFIRRELRCGNLTVYAYGIDGLIASSAASDYIFKPIQHLPESMEDAYQTALTGGIYNAVAKPCKDADDAAEYYFDRVKRKKEHGAKYDDNILQVTEDEFEGDEA